MGDDSTPHAAGDPYSRVTNPERYRVLHGAAFELLDQLQRDYVLERHQSGALDPGLTSGVAADTVVRLEPHAGHGAPLTVAFTTFPGLLVRFGRWHVEAFPRCGCDACDESPASLIKDLADEVGCVIAGGFREELRAGRVRKAVRCFEFSSESWSHGGEALVEREALRRLGQPGEVDWPGWTRR